MIQSFGDESTRRVFMGEPPKKFERIARAIQRKLLMVHAAHVIVDLKMPPGNRLESLKGNRSGHYSIRVNDQWRICFIWKDGNAYDVTIEDYH